jgi:alginate O-acetyltransferase complex protein AlgI
MLFNSIEYLLLLFPSVLIYWLTGNLFARQCILFFASIVFYMSWSKVFTLLLIILVFINWIFGFLIDRKKTRAVLAIAIITNLSILFYFKYINFVIENTIKLLGYATDIPLESSFYVSVILPLGISFFIFEFISYLIDIYRKDATPERNFIVFSLFVMFFPHLIAGPICRANAIFQQLKTKVTFNKLFFTNGIFIFLCGMFLKIVIADNLSPIVDNVYSNLNSSQPAEVAYAALLFSVVILCDFWGYSTMALGSAYLFGIKLPFNFDLPYLSSSLQEFWRRWHITLSMWLRDYLYISLGGSQKGALMTYRNLFLVMFIGGIWHGAGWCFLIWGSMHGLWLVLERLVKPATNRINSLMKSFLGWGITFLFVTLLWIPFRLNDLNNTILAFKKMLTISQYQIPLTSLQETFFYLCLFLISHYHINLYTRRAMENQLFSIGKNIVVSFWLLIIIVIFGSSSVESFIYFQF